MERLRNGRDRLISRFRQINLESSGAEGDNDVSIISDVMKEEWSVMKNSLLRDLQDDPLSCQSQSPGNDEEVDEILSIMDEIKRELQREEQHMLEEYRASEMFEQSQLADTIGDTDPNKVICPICKRNWLLQNKNVIFCACGLRLDMEQDGLMLSNLKQQLENGVTSHELMSCTGSAQFFACSEGGITSLMMSCPSCDFMFVVV